KDRGPGGADSVHSAPAPRPLPADRPRRGSRMMFARQLTTVLGAPDRGAAACIATAPPPPIGAAVLNLVVPESSALHLSTFGLMLIGKYMCYAMLALAVDLAWGYLGILSLGHAAFFALGGYAMGMYLMRQIGTRGVYGHP